MGQRGAALVRGGAGVAGLSVTGRETRLRAGLGAWERGERAAGGERSAGLGQARAAVGRRGENGPALG